MALLVDEIRLLEARIGQLERELSELARLSPACTTLLSIPGIGLLTAHRDGGGNFGRREPLQGCAALCQLVRADALQSRSNHNKAACALANKLARICYATLRDKERFDETQSLAKKLGRQAFVMPA